ncbi:ABC transporter ATP-binding protein, partial [uncultured Desulfovibrio sp.]|uniref:ABC transporter ATP-binding protein n=1 Tax=uncultured Desulfovibrio sp. TaxID=167968 RepID=UPI00261C797B
TFFNCITGIYEPTEGTVRLQPRSRMGSGASAGSPAGEQPDQDDAPARALLLNGRKPHEVTRLGMARTFQNIRLFPTMTVLENVMVGRHCRTRAGIWGALSRDGHTRREEQESIDISYALLESLHLQNLWNEKARNLSYGAQRRLEIARALATEPRMLLLDEPAAGMNPQETHELEILVRGIRDARNLSILLIEHDMSMVMSLSDRIYVMEYGSCIAMGKPEEVRANPRVIKAYLGESDA